MNGKLLSLVLFTVLFASSSYGQNATGNGYQIRVELPGISDTTLILAHRYGNKFFTDDTVRTNHEGMGVFYGDEALPWGMYQVVLPDRSFFDFFIDADQHMTLKSKPGDFVTNNNAVGHKLNQLFFNWHRASIIYKGQPEMDIVWDTTLQRAGYSMIGKFLRGIRPFQVPSVLANNPDWRKNKTAQYQYYKSHFFDDVDLHDTNLLRTPLIYNKLNQFFTKIVPPEADSIISYAEEILLTTKQEPEIFRFCVQFLLNYYSEPKIMGTDAVYVYIAEKYYLSGIADWVDKDNLKIISERVKELKPLLIGNEAPALPALQTPEGEFVQISESSAKWLVLYFWEPDCGHCKKSTPQLHEAYKEIKSLGAEVFAINTRLDKEAWIKFIAEHELSWVNLYSPHHIREVLESYQAWSTPKIFIVDNKQRIVAKDLAVDQVVSFLRYLNKKS